MSAVLSSLTALVVLAAWRHAVPGGILFYQGIVVALLAGLVQGGWAWRRAGGPARVRAGLSFKDGLLVTLLVYAFVFTVPTTVDRSYSVRLLQRVARAEGGVSEQQITSDFLRDFATSGGVKRRLEEQRATGTLQDDAGTWRLTPTGRALTDAFRATCAVFVCQPS